MALCQHLRADQQIQFALIEIKQSFFELVPARLGVAIDSSDAQGGKAFAQEFFDLLSALADVINVLAGASGTLRGRALMVIAIVANQNAIGLMIGERHVAVRTVDRLAARATKNETRIAAPIQKDDRLLTTRVSLGDGS